MRSRSASSTCAARGSARRGPDRHRRRRHRALARSPRSPPAASSPIVVSDFNAERLRARDAIRRARPRRPGRAVSLRGLARARERARASSSRPWSSSASEPPGSSSRIIDSCEMWTRIYAAGGWYTGDSLDCTEATHKGVSIHFGGGPHARGLVRHPRRDLRGSPRPAPLRRQGHRPRRRPRGPRGDAAFRGPAPHRGPSDR